MIQELKIRIGADGRGFEGTINRLQGVGARFAQNLKSQFAAAFSTAILAQRAREVVQFAGQIADLGKKTKASSEFLQQLAYAADQNGASIDTVSAALRGLAKARADALSGDATKLATFDAFGVSKAALESEKLENIFKRIAQTLHTTDFGEDELPMVEAILTRAGADLLPLIKEGFSNAAAEAERLGIILADPVIKNLDAAGDSVDKLAARIRGPLGAAIGFAANRVREIVDFLDLGFGSTGAFLGGLIYGKGGPIERFKTAKDLALQHAGEILDARIKADQAIIEPVREKGIAVRPQHVVRERGQAEQITRSSLLQLTPHLNQLQAIGGAGGERGRLVQSVELTNKKLDVLHQDNQKIEQRIQEKEGF